MSNNQKTVFDVLGRIDEERTKRQWTMYTLAKNSGLPQSTISSWFQHNYQPSIASIEQICDAFSISLSDFFNDSPVASDHLTEGQQHLLELWNRMNPDQREKLTDLLQVFLDE